MIEELLAFVRENRGPWTLLAVYAAAALEYLVPPLPADSVLLMASLLIVAGTQSFPMVAAVAVTGGATGALVHYFLGRALSRPDGTFRGEKWVDLLFGKGRVDRFMDLFRRRGMWAIAVNRALPGVRAVTFFAAGVARLPLGKTMAFGLISNVVWTVAILALGTAVGGSAEKIQGAFAVYRTVLYSLGAILVLAVLIAWWWRKRRSA
jgi:membrane protein DedA with SNARE-associated domain